jgi:hypothetical protein
MTTTPKAPKHELLGSTKGLTEGMVWDGEGGKLTQAEYHDMALNYQIAQQGKVTRNEE